MKHLAKSETFAGDAANFAYSLVLLSRVLLGFLFLLSFPAFLFQF